MTTIKNGLAQHSETGEELVIYENCEYSQQQRENILRARPLTLFIEKVEKDGKEIPRFQYLGN